LGFARETQGRDLIMGQLSKGKVKPQEEWE